jgi:hypothetical protein
MNSMVSVMLRLFRDGVQSYQPETKELARETGDPQVSLENMERILAARLLIQYILIRPAGVLFTFSTGEQFYATGLRAGTRGPATEALAQIAAKARFGSYERLLRHLQCLAPDYDGPLLPLIRERTLVSDGHS